MTQWHPLFAQLLRPLVEDCFEVATNVAVGDLPREADLVLLRQTSRGPLPYKGLWKHLTTWNVLEYKGPTVSPRLADLDLLVELGLGIHRRLNETRREQEGPKLEPDEVSLWLLAHLLGKRFREGASRYLGGLDLVEEGVWRYQVLGRIIYFVSAANLPVTRDALPFHLLDHGAPAKELDAAKLVISEPGLWRLLGTGVMRLPAGVLEELREMARTAKDPWSIINLEPIVELLGLDAVIKKLGSARVIAQLGPDHVIEELGFERVIELVGLERVLEIFGPDRVIAKLGTKGFRNKINIDNLLAVLSPAQRNEIKQRLQNE